MGKKFFKQVTLALAMAVVSNGFAYGAPVPATRDQVEQRIEEMDNQIVEVMSQIDKNKKQIAQNQKDITTADKQVQEAQANLDKESDLYRDRVRAMYINGLGDYITIIFESKGLSDFLSRIEMVEKIIDNNKEVTQELIKSQNDITAKKKVLDSKKTNLLTLQSDNEKKLNVLNKSKDDELKLLAELKKSQGNLYAANDASYNTTMKQIQQIRQNAPKISASRGTLAVSSNYVIAYASNFLGTKYVWGGESPNPGFDCSGFTQYVFGHFGVSLDRTTYGQINDGASVSKDQLQPGDLVFFGTASNPHHVGIYVGNGMYIHAPQTGDVVKVSSIGRSDFVKGVRVK
jgi:peptidoglycan DL-endopeptidase CwlO